MPTSTPVSCSSCDICHSSAISSSLVRTPALSFTKPSCCRNCACAEQINRTRKITTIIFIFSILNNLLHFSNHYLFLSALRFPYVFWRHFLNLVSHPSAASFSISRSFPLRRSFERETETPILRLPNTNRILFSAFLAHPSANSPVTFKETLPEKSTPDNCCEALLNIALLRLNGQYCFENPISGSRTINLSPSTRFA